MMALGALLDYVRGLSPWRHVVAVHVTPSGERRRYQLTNVTWEDEETVIIEIEEEG